MNKKTIIRILFGILFIIIIYLFYTNLSLEREVKITKKEKNIYLETNYKCQSINQNTIVAIAQNIDEELNLKIDNKNIIASSMMKDNLIHIKSSSIAGRTNIKIIGITTKEEEILTIDTYNLKTKDIGKVININEEASTEIIKEGEGELTCASSDNTKATCRIENQKLYVLGISPGTVNININNIIYYQDKLYECGNTKFLAVIK